MVVFKFLNIEMKTNLSYRKILKEFIFLTNNLSDGKFNKYLKTTRENMNRYAKLFKSVIIFI